MNAKNKGQISEARVLYEFQKYGIPVCIPWGDNERYDLIAEFDGKFNRIQVKTANEERNGAVLCYARSSTNHTTNKKLKNYIGQVDYFVFVNQKKDILAIVPIADIPEGNVLRLRLEPTKSGQVKGTHYFKDYSFQKKFCNISSIGRTAVL